MADQSGFMAISPPIPQGPIARRKVIRGLDGTPQVIFVDANTGAELSNGLAGYTVIENNSGGVPPLDQAGLNPIAPAQSTPSAAQQVIAPARNQKLERADLSHDESTAAGRSYGRNPTNNFGYVNKPTGMGLINAVPGPIGMAGKAINTGVNINNVAAVNAARGMMGLPDQSFGEKAKGALRDNKGQVGDVDVNGVTHSAGFEALSPQGRTNMTPDEAAKRARANDSSLALSSQEDIDRAQEDFDNEFGHQSRFSKALHSAGQFLSDLFGDDEPEYAAAPDYAANNSGDNFKPTDSGFMDMLEGKSSNSSGEKPDRPDNQGNSETSSGRLGGPV